MPGLINRYSTSSEPSSGYWSPGCSGQLSHALENAARLALSSRLGRALTDEEWAQTSAKMFEFVTILRRWDNKDRTPPLGLGNVEALCQPEP